MFIFTLAQSANKFHYGIYTYTECNSKPFTCTTLVITWIFKKWKHGTKDGWIIVFKQIQSFVSKFVDQSWECVRPLTRLFCAVNFQLMDVKTLVVAK
jgi:hypothetical protein